MNTISKKSFCKRYLIYFMAVILCGTSLNFSIFTNTTYAAGEYTILYFVDSTTEHWISNDNAVIELVDNTNGHNSYIMNQVDKITWKVQVPTSTYNVTFNRYDADRVVKWNSWSAGGRDNNNTYYAKGHEYGGWGITEEEQPDDEDMYFKQPTQEDIIFDTQTGIIYVQNQLLISALPGASKSIFETITDNIGADIVGYIGLTNDYQIEFREQKTLEELQNIADYLESFSFVYEVTLNTVLETDSDLTTTNDKLYDGDDWNEEAPNGYNWGLEALKVPSAWDSKSDFESVRIGLIDNMFDESHEDLTFEQTINNSVFISENHGTHVAGIMAALHNNSTGISGVVTDSKLYGYATTNNTQNMQTVMVYKYAFASLISKNVKVINVSQNTGRLQCFAASHGNENAINYVKTNAAILGNFLDKLILQGYDFVIVAAAGNVESLKYCASESETYGFKTYDPATDSNYISGNALAYYNSYLNAIDLESVKSRIITVGAVGHSVITTGNGKITSYYYANFSNTGSRVDVCAPGVDIVSTIPAHNANDPRYDSLSGTSMAAPYIAGLSGMLYQANPDLNGVKVKQIICDNTSVQVMDSHGNSYEMPDAELCVEEALQYNGENTGSVLPSGILTGMVKNSNGNPLEGVKITAYRTSVGESNLENYFTVGTTDQNGNYEMVLGQGTYNLNIYAEGYLPCVIENVVIKPDETTYMENIIVVTWNIDFLGYDVDGHVINAIDGSPIADATIKYRKGWNNKIGKYVKNILGQEITTQTDGAGNFTSSLPIGIYTVEIQKAGFVTGYYNIVSTKETVSGLQTMVLTPVLSEDEYRIVLTWGIEPSDLDSHLSYYDGNTRMMHVYYSQKTGNLSGQRIAELDLDDTTSYGPETVTIKLSNALLDNGKFKYSIHDYTNRYSTVSNSLSMSGAVVRVYKGNNLMNTYNVPRNKEGTVWHVFEITKEGIVSVNEFEYNSEPSSIN